MNTPDVLVTGSGSVFLFHPRTPDAVAWVSEHIGDDAQRLGNAIAVEHRYIADLVTGARLDGLVVQWN